MGLPLKSGSSGLGYVTFQSEKGTHIVREVVAIYYTLLTVHPDKNYRSEFTATTTQQCPVSTTKAPPDQKSCESGPCVFFFGFEEANLCAVVHIR